MSKYKKMAEIADLSITLVSLVSFAAYFMFPHVVLAKEISKSKNLEFDISKAVKVAQISAIAPTSGGASETVRSGEKINYKPSAVIAEPPSVSEDYKVIGKRQVYVTAYSSTPDQTDSTPFITASNTHVRDGIVAANFLPFGTKIRIPAIYPDKIFVVEDRMNARYNHRADIWFSTRQEAVNFGIKWLDIEILAEN